MGLLQRKPGHSLQASASGSFSSTNQENWRLHLGVRCRHSQEAVDFPFGDPPPDNDSPMDWEDVLRWIFETQLSSTLGKMEPEEMLRCSRDEDELDLLPMELEDMARWGTALRDILK